MTPLATLYRSRVPKFGPSKKIPNSSANSAPGRRSRLRRAPRAHPTSSRRPAPRTAGPCRRSQRARRRSPGPRANRPHAQPLHSLGMPRSGAVLRGAGDRLRAWACPRALCEFLRRFRGGHVPSFWWPSSSDGTQRERRVGDSSSLSSNDSPRASRREGGLRLRRPPLSGICASQFATQSALRQGWCRRRGARRRGPCRPDRSSTQSSCRRIP
jgi:hypothetical protein